MSTSGSETASANTTQSDLFSATGENVVENPLKCPLDLSHFEHHSGEAGLETLLGKTRLPPTEISIPVKSQPSIDVFLKSRKSSLPKHKKPVAAATNSDVCKDFLSPFQRYQLLKPFMDSIKTGWCCLFPK